MKILLLAIGFALTGCADLPSNEEPQEIQPTFYGADNSSVTNAPAREPVPGEAVPGR